MKSARRERSTTAAKRGRPERTFVDRARAVVWAHAVRARAGLYSSASPTRLRAELKRRYPWGVRHFPTASVFYKYLRGEAGPSKEVVAEIDTILTGMAAIYEHPLWELARVTEISSQRLCELLCALPRRLTKPILLSETPGRMFWRRQQVDLHEVFELALNRPSIDHAALALAVVHDCVLRQDEPHHFEAWCVWAQVGNAFRHDDPAVALFPHFFALVARRIRAVAYADQEKRARLDAMFEQAQADQEHASRAMLDPRSMAALADRTIGEILAADLSLLYQLVRSAPAIDPMFQ
ncbi:hypothetical protein FBR04_20980 [Betaproteobacteria bacterium PRO7]|nr:hypothetical protein [Betaproteobacteria bacterium PRO7]